MKSPNEMRNEMTATVERYLLEIDESWKKVAAAPTSKLPLNLLKKLERASEELYSLVEDAAEVVHDS